MFASVAARYGGISCPLLCRAYLTQTKNVTVGPIHIAVGLVLADEKRFLRSLAPAHLAEPFPVDEREASAPVGTHLDLHEANARHTARAV